MLSRTVALRAIKYSTITSPCRLRLGAPNLAASPLTVQGRAYASSNKPKRGPPAPAKGRPGQPPPPPSPTERLLPGNVRQTSPGTSLSRSQVQQPKVNTYPARTQDARASAATLGAASPVQGTRPTQQPMEQTSPLEGNAAPQEPVAQKEDADEPVPGSLRDAAHSRAAESENTPAPEQFSPQQPLPDLRRGIPSTFDFEFGGAEKQESGRAAAEEASQEEKLDLTSAPEESQRQRERGGRDYDSSAYETSTDRRRNQVANYLFVSTLFIALGGCFYFARPYSTMDDLPAGLSNDDAYTWGPGSMYARVKARIGSQMGYYTEPSFPKLLPEIPESQRQPFTLVMSLEDLMIHTTWDTKNGYRMAKRPGVDYFIRYLSQYYELVLFTSAPRAMADPVMAKLDPYHFIMWPLGREATKYENGEYVKDLTYLNRPLSKTLIIDTQAGHVKNQPENAIILSKWLGDPKDPHTKDLVGLIPFLEYLATMGTEDVRTVLKSFEGKDIPEEFARRESLARARFNAQLESERSKRPKRSLGSLAAGLGVKSMGGGMVLADGQSVAEGLAQGKMLSDQIREQGQKQYEHLEKQIRENGEQWLREEKEEQARLMEASMKDMKRGAFGWFGGSKEEPSK